MFNQVMDLRAQYDAFHAFCGQGDVKYLKTDPALRTLINRQPLSHTTSVGGTNSAFDMQFFSDTTQTNPVVRTIQPKLQYGAQAPIEFLIGILAIGIKVDIPKLGATLAFDQRDELISALGESTFVLASGGDIIVEAKGDEVLFGAPGLAAYSDGGVTPKFTSGQVLGTQVPLWLPKMAIINPGASFTADLFINKASWVSLVVDPNIDLYMPSFVAQKGNPQGTPNFYSA